MTVAEMRDYLDLQLRSLGEVVGVTMRNCITCNRLHASDPSLIFPRCAECLATRKHAAPEVVLEPARMLLAIRRGQEFPHWYEFVREWPSARDGFWSEERLVDWIRTNRVLQRMLADKKSAAGKFSDVADQSPGG